MSHGIAASTRRTDSCSEFRLDDDPPRADIDQLLAPTPTGAER